MRVYRFCNVGPEQVDPDTRHGRGMSTSGSDGPDVVVVDRSGGGMGVILGVIVLGLLIVGIWFFAFGPGQGAFDNSNSKPNDINVNVELPSVAPEGS
jgi:hypothetical protein